MTGSVRSTPSGRSHGCGAPGGVLRCCASCGASRPPTGSSPSTTSASCGAARGPAGDPRDPAGPRSAARSSRARRRSSTAASAPPPIARCRWQRLWLAEHRGAVLPPISVVAVGDAYAIRDGHHRVSVARARGALMIDAIVGAATDPGT